MMLTMPGREEYAKLATDAWDAQKYPNKWMLTLKCKPDATIGAMRNYAVSLMSNTDIIVHWDDDDWSHPNRIAEQVALLQSAGADCVGYNEMLFWREPCGAFIQPPASQGNWPRCTEREFPGEAWLYSNPNPRYALGTSLCYWRRAWEARPFPDLQHGEDTEWLKSVYVRSESANGIEFMPDEKYRKIGGGGVHGPVPRMIARIHSGNSSSAYDPIEMARHNALPRSERQWSRVPEWDKVCRGAMER